MSDKGSYKNLLEKVDQLESENRTLKDQLKERDLKSSQLKEKFDLLANNFKDVICLHKQDGKYLYVSSSCRNILGYEPEHLIGSDPWRFVHPDDLPSLAKQAERKMNGGEGLSTYRIRKKDGSYIWFESVNQMIRDRDGNITKFVTSSRDITERKIAEQRVIESEARYRSIIENSSDPITIIHDRKIIFYNNAFLYFLGFSKGKRDSLGTFDKITSQIVSSIKFDEIPNDINSPIPLKLESTITKDDGLDIDVEISVKRIIFDDQQSLLVTIRDISKQKEIIKLLETGIDHSTIKESLIPICAGCSNIRDDRKETPVWEKPADYLNRKYPILKFTHTMCQDCIEKFYPELKHKMR